MNKFCGKCGGKLEDGVKFCPNCGEINQVTTDTTIERTNGSESRTNQINITLATILGYIIPGLPSVIWFNQRKKGWIMVVVSVLLTSIFSVFIGIILGAIGAIDAYKIAGKLNKGEKIEEWTFF
ncbi:MAG: hypothetical protein ACK5NA_00935 [Enterococcus sp.]